jgi:hypothetical protein
MSSAEFIQDLSSAKYPGVIELLCRYTVDGKLCELSVDMNGEW